jgi:PEP-CTERM motif
MGARRNVPMPDRWLFLAVAAVVAMSIPGEAGAVPISGSFSGTAVDSRLRQSNGEFIDFDGETITGSFEIDPAMIPTTSPTISPDGTTASFIHSEPAPYVSLSLNAHGRTVNFVSGQTGDVLELLSDDQGQQVSFGIGALYPYHNAGFVMAGPPGSLFSPFLPQTLRVDADTLLTFVTFFDSRDFGAGVADLAVEFDGIAVAIPEPGALGLLGVGLMGMTWMRRNRPRTTAQDRMADRCFDRNATACPAARRV